MQESENARLSGIKVQGAVRIIGARSETWDVQRKIRYWQVTVVNVARFRRWFGG